MLIQEIGAEKPKTDCSLCVHSEVCQYKKKYQHMIEEMKSTFEKLAGSKSAKFQTPICNFYYGKPLTNFRSDERCVE